MHAPKRPGWFRRGALGLATALTLMTGFKPADPLPPTAYAQRNSPMLAEARADERKCQAYLDRLNATYFNNELDVRYDPDRAANRAFMKDLEKVVGHPIPPPRSGPGFRDLERFTCWVPMYCDDAAFGLRYPVLVGRLFFEKAGSDADAVSQFVHDRQHAQDAEYGMQIGAEAVDRGHGYRTVIKRIIDEIAFEALLELRAHDAEDRWRAGRDPAAAGLTYRFHAMQQGDYGYRAFVADRAADCGNVNGRLRKILRSQLAAIRPPPFELTITPNHVRVRVSYNGTSEWVGGEADTDHMLAAFR